MTKSHFKIKNMTCTACAKAVERAVKKLDGVEEATVNYATEKLMIQYDEGKVKNSDIVSAIERAGYGAEDEDQKPIIDAKASGEEKSHNKMNPFLLRFIFAAIFTVPLLYISMGHMAGLPLPEFLNPTYNPSAFAIAQLILTIPVVAFGYKFYTVGFRTLFKGSPNMDTLVAVGTSAAFIYGVYGVIRITSGSEHYVHRLYFESAAVIITLISLGKYFENRSKGKTSEAIRKLVELAPETAIIIKDGEEKEVKIEEIAVGDMVVVKPGGRIPVDGVVTEGSTFVDESMLTGESIPVEKGTGDNVTGGSINKNGIIRFRVLKVGDDTVLSHIIKLVEEAQESRAPIARLADVISGYFVPIVMGLAVISAIAWYLSGESVEFSLTIFISVLVIACPCALGLATPTAIMVGTGKGAENGILIKSGEALETSHKIKVIVFDKTGTITEGRPRVTDIITSGNIEEDDLISIAASCEKSSEHPLGEAIVKEAEARKLTLSEVTSFNAIPGNGIECILNGNRVYIGNSALLSKRAIGYKEYEKILSDLGSKGRTPMLIADEHKVLGVIAVSDTIKDTSRDAIENIKRMGITPVMLTGDNKKTAEAVARSVGIETTLSEVLPQDKANEIKRLQKDSNVVAMVGDGINDAPALAQADVGFAIGSGTDIAIESADIVLMKSNLMDVVSAIQLSRSTIKNIKENLGWAFGYNIIGIPIAMGVLHIFGGPLLNPMIAGAAMSLSSVSVVTNALRLRRFKPNVKVKSDGRNRIMKKKVSIEGMMCMHCVNHVKEAISAIDGVKDVEVFLKENYAMVTVDDTVYDQNIKYAIKEAGYKVVGIEDIE